MTDNPQQFIYYPQQPPMAQMQAPKPGVVPLQPLDVGAIIGGSFRAIFRNWQAAILIPFVAFLIATGGSLIPLVNIFSAFRATINYNRPTAEQAESLFGNMLLFVGLELVLMVAAMLITEAIVTVVVSRAVLGRTTSIPQALRAAGPRLLPLLGLNTLIWLIVAACVVLPFAVTVAFAVALNSPGLAALGVLLTLAGACLGSYFWTQYALAPAAVMLEPAPALTAMRRSKWLVTGGWWRVFGILALCGLMTYIVSYVMELPVSAIQFAQLPDVMAAGPNADPLALFDALFSPGVLVAVIIVSALVASISQPFMTSVATLIYHDLRIRKESFHLPLWEMSQRPDDLSPQPAARPEATA